MNEFAFWSRQPYFCLNFQSEALIVSVCLCALPGEPLRESVPAAQGGMDGAGGLPQYRIFSSMGCTDKERGRFYAQIPCQGGRPLGVDPDQKAVKEKLSVRT